MNDTISLAIKEAPQSTVDVTITAMSNSELGAHDLLDWCRARLLQYACGAYVLNSEAMTHGKADKSGHITFHARTQLLVNERFDQGFVLQ